MATDEFYISEAFMDKMTVHAKNFMDLPRIKVPTILGVWGGRARARRSRPPWCGELGVQPIIMSAGELRSGNAGSPPS